jgi:subtilisin family serine protease
VPPRVRRLALLGAPLLLLAGPAGTQASSAHGERAALRTALRGAASSSRASGLRLPLPEQGDPATVSASAAARLARRTAPARVLVGLRRHEDAPAVAARLRGLGLRPRLIDALGALAGRAPSPARLVAALRVDPRVAYVEPDLRLRVSAEPFDAVDPDIGRPYTWAYGAVNAGPAIAAAGGGSARLVAVIDTGADETHPDLAANLVPGIDSRDGSADVRDFLGHGTFVAGLVSAVDGNSIGTKGVAGRTRVLPIRGSENGAFSLAAVINGIVAALGSGADIVNLSLAGGGFSPTQARAFNLAYFANVLPVAASGNHGDQGNPLEFPAAQLGGVDGGVGLGLSVAAVTPTGAPAFFSTHNRFVSLGAPGAAEDPSDPAHGVFSTIPRGPGTFWDDPDNQSRVFNRGKDGRYAYAEGTSFATPIVSGIAALAWQVERRLNSDQVADVLQRSARQTFHGTGWNQFTGWGVVDGAGAVQEARVYDVTPPKPRARARRRGPARVSVRLLRSRDRTRSGDHKAGHVRYALLVSRNGGRTFRFVVRPRRRPFRRSVRLKGRRRNVLSAVFCDGNFNCAAKRFRFRRRR